MSDRTAFAAMCRLCLSENSLLFKVDFKDQCNKKRSTKKAAQITRQIIEEFTTIVIQSEDSLPQKICKSCVKVLKSMLDFQEKCKQNNEELHQRVKDLESPVSVTSAGTIKTEVELKNEINENQSEDEISEGIGVEETDSLEIVGSIEGEDECETKETLNVNEDSLLKTSEQVTPKPLKRKRKSAAERTTGMKACHICGKLIPNYNFPYHINKHDGLKPFACDVDNCTSTFASPYELQCHNRMVHIREPHLSCDVCGKAFKRNQALLEHRTYHFDPKIPCKICEKLFRNDRALQKHMLVHTMERKYKCEICHKSFQTGYTLRVHKRVHTNEKPYSCHCGMSFAHKCLLKAHTEKYHK